MSDSEIDFGPQAHRIITRLRAMDLTAAIVDRSAVERAVCKHFRALGMEPLPVRWVVDAEKGYNAAKNAALNAAKNAALSAAWSAAWSAARSAAWSAARSAARSAALNAAKNAALSAAWSAALNAAKNAALSATKNAALSATKNAAESTVWSTVWSTAESADLHAIGRPVLEMEKWIGIWMPMVTAYRAGLWLYWVTETEVIAVPRPAIQIENRRLHCATGPAVAWPNGTRYYFWRGTQVPRDWIEMRERLAPETALMWPNVEQRRAAAEIIGWESVLAALQPTIVHTDPNPEVGTLLRVDLPDAPGSQFLKVRCGTGRTFCLPVPAEMKTARQANAWTYGLDEADYRPEVRT